MKNTLLIFCLVLLHQNSNAQWLFTGSTGATFVRGLYFNDVNTGYAAGISGSIFKTVDGGVSWTAQNSGTSVQLRSVTFIDYNIGYICGQDEAGAGTVLKTIDGGTTWSSSNNGVTGYCRAVDFPTPEIGFLAGAGGLIFKTTDAGANWSSYSLGIASDVIQLDMIDASTGYAAAGDGSLVNGYIFKTTDGGDSWIQVYNDPLVGFLALAVADDNTIYAGGSALTIVKSDDGGLNWNTVYTGGVGAYRAAFATSEDEAYFTSDQSSVSHTIDGGTSWENSTVGTQGLFCIHFPTETRGYTCDFVGAIYRNCIPGELITYYADGDSDGFGNTEDALTVASCTPPPGYTIASGDCNDTEATIHPGAFDDQDGNGIDNNCDGCIDGILLLLFPDADGDGYGDSNSSGELLCYGPGTYNLPQNNLDCDDSNAAIHPDVPEICFNSVDENCNGILDDPTISYADADGDGYGDPASQLYGCSQPGYVLNALDCNDNDAAVNPAALEYPPNGVDDNCDGCVDDYLSNLFPDNDGDGYGDANAGVITGCAGTPGYSIYFGDCDDNNAFINPAAVEDCTNGIDDNCNGGIDEFLTFYADADGDGFGDINSSIQDCSPPNGYVSDASDCNDADAAINPYAYDDPFNGIDDNCDGCIDSYLQFLYPDADGDGYGDLNGSVQTVCGTLGYAFNNLDCDDNNSTIHPGANEISDGIDQDCDGQVDEIQACSPGIEYDQSLGGTNSDYATSLALAADGDFVVTGYTFSQDVDITCYPTNTWTVKTNSSGDIDWQACTNGFATSIVAAPDNGYVVAGFNVDQFHIAKLNDNGIITWQKDFGGTNYEQCNAACPGSDGGYILSGYTESDDGDVSGNHGGQDIWVIKVDDNGDLVWQKCFGGSGADVANSIVQTSDGGYFVSGATSSSDGDVTGFHGYNDGWVLKLDAEGNLQWQKAIGTAGFEYFQAGIQTTDGGYALAGVTGNGSLLKLDANGDTEWEQYSEGGAASLFSTNDGAFLITGYVYPVYSAIQDAWVAKFKDTGELQWSKNMGGSGAETAMSIRQTMDGGYFVAGFSNSIDGDISNPINDYDYWLVKLSGDPSYGLHTYYSDADGDGYGNPNDSITDVSCSPIAGYAATGNDCNDSNADINPGEMDDCSNGMDDDCNGIIDDGTIATFYADVDNDGYGDSNSFVEACIAPTGYVLNSLDCDDNNSSINPEATEVCNSLDDDCDFSIDEDLPLYTYYHDADEDNYGTIDVTLTTCADTPPAGYVSNFADCNDNNLSINPEAAEVCNSLDDDCDFFVDEDLLLYTYYYDADEDNYGTIDVTLTTCADTPPAGYVFNSSDCNDNNSSINPEAAEVCNSLDDDCDFSVDEDLPLFTYYHDADQDSYGTIDVMLTTCADTPPAGYVSSSSDCNDNNSSINPEAAEVCNNLDDDCDFSVDEDLPLFTYYHDADQDSYGTIDVMLSTCADTPPAGYVSNASDCNDNLSSVNPGANEICFNLIDDNCNGVADENCSNCEGPSTITVTNITASSAKLNWDATNGAIGYKVRYKIAGTSGWIHIPSIDNDKTLHDLSAGTEYVCQVKSICGVLPIVSSDWSEKPKFTTAPLKLEIASGNPDPVEVSIHPNPFNSSAIISFSLHQDSRVLIELFDVEGRRLQTVLEADEIAGTHELSINKGQLSAGIYMVRFLINGEMIMKKVVITR